MQGRYPKNIYSFYSRFSSLLTIRYPKKVKIVEVGARDGLQIESDFVPTNAKINFINRLSQAGFTHIEPTGFVSPKWIPQFADHQYVFENIIKKAGTSYPVLVPNLKGLETAIHAKVSEIAVFTSPSESFCKKNTNCTVQESMARITEIVRKAQEHKIRVRAYQSCVLGCPDEGEVAPEKIAQQAKKLFALGCYEISLGDTIGTGTPVKVLRLLQAVTASVPVDNLAVHFHDTYGQALANICVALQCGISTIDSSAAGLGGCPYAKSATGNVATEDVVYMLHGMGIETGIDIGKLMEASRYILQVLKKQTLSKVHLALNASIGENTPVFSHV